MLNNHLTFIRRKSSLLLLISLCFSCASNKDVHKKKRTKSKKVDSSYCLSKSSKFEKKNLVTVAQIKSSVLGACFSNYLRFEKNKKQTIGTCNQLSIKKNGKVSYVQVTDIRRKNLPKDLEMCMEQEFWKMSFKGLYLSKPYYIQFPLNFTSK